MGQSLIEPVLDIVSLSKTFPGQVALSEAAMTVLPGQVHALVGQNGSGKSTLIKILAGYHRPDPGSDVRLLGHPVDIAALSDADRARIHVMHQDLGLVDSLNSVENLALGRGFKTTRMGRIRWRAETERASALLERFDATFDPRVPTASLTPSERAILALARALQEWDDSGGVLVLDEPTASLPRPEVDRLFAAVRRVAERGAGVVFVSHRLDEVFEIADHVTILRDGRVTASMPTSQLDHQRLITLIVGRELEERASVATGSESASVLDICGLWGDVVEGFDLSVRAGEVVGVAGLVGSGRDELPGLVFGASHRTAGTVSVSGRDVPADPHRAVEAGMAFVPADRKRHGVIASQSLRHNITLPRLGTLTTRGRLSRRAESAEARRWVDRVDLRPPDPDRRVATLSGGNQQKAVLARWLRTEPRVLILDEPTQGVDVGAKASIYALLGEAAATGMAMLLCSSETEELVLLCDRVVVLREGRIAAELTGDTLNQENIVNHMLAQEVLG